MIKKNLISLLKFTLFWVIFNYSIGSLDHLNEAPMSVHQGAQCDRASLALNYYHNGMRLLYPEVHENRCRDGIVSCELPLTNYLTAGLYKVFGFHEKWFRLLTFLLISAGMFALFLLFRLYVKPLTAYILIFIINSSPIVLFYATNFIPDAGSLGLVLISWYLFFRLFIPHPFIPNTPNRVYLFIFVISLSLAIASKTTCIIQWMSMAGILIFSYFKKLKIELNDKKNLLRSLLCVLIIPFLWQVWAQHLGKLHNSEFFMLHIPLPESFEEFFKAWQVYASNWPGETYHFPLPFIIVGLIVMPLFLKRHISNSLWYLSIFNALGGTLFLIVMMKQFMYHDYYILCLLPCFFINWLALASALPLIKSKYWRVKIAAFILITWALYLQFNAGKENLKSRFTAGNYWEQSQQNTKDYSAFKTKINQMGVDRKQCVLVGYDGAPNNVLYLLDLNGRRINSDFTDEQITTSIGELNPTYVISNDSLFTERIRPHFKGLQMVVREKYLTLFKTVR